MAKIDEYGWLKFIPLKACNGKSPGCDGYGWHTPRVIHSCMCGSEYGDMLAIRDTITKEEIAAICDCGMAWVLKTCEPCEAAEEHARAKAYAEDQAEQSMRDEVTDEQLAEGCR